MEQHPHGNTAARIGDIVYGAHDGIITTFAIIAGSVGAGLTSVTVVILGIANVIADGISMAASSYLARKSEVEASEFQRAQEEWETKHEPEEERAEVREILAQKGYSGNDLELLTDLIIKNPNFWVDFMMKEEVGFLGSQAEGRPLNAALTTFASFVAAGAIPLLPYFAALKAPAAEIFPAAIVAAILALLGVGIMRSLVALKKWYVTSLEMLAVGSIAGGSAYAIGALLRLILGS
jgi:VIT1/CCC1 family predicted Fe2+/Mn2+ transporter